MKPFIDIISWVALGLLSIPVASSSFPKKEITRGDAITYAVAGPISLAIFCIAWTITDDKCIANCKE